MTTPDQPTPEQPEPESIWLDHDGIIKAIKSMPPWERVVASTTLFKECRRLAIAAVNDIRYPAVDEIRFSDDPAVRRSVADMARELDMYESVLYKRYKDDSVTGKSNDIFRSSGRTREAAGGPRAALERSRQRQRQVRAEEAKKLPPRKAP